MAQAKAVMRVTSSLQKRHFSDGAALTPHQRMHQSMSNPRGKQLWAKVRENLSVLVPPKQNVRYRRSLTPPLMFDPDSDIKIKWDLALALCVLYTTCVVPVRISFGLEASGIVSVFEVFIDVAFFFDIAFSFRTGIINPTTGQVYYNKRQIAQEYIRGWFLIDFASTVPIESIVKWLYPDSSSNTFSTAKIFRGLKLARLLKLVRIRKISNMISKFEEEVFANQSFLSLVKILLFLLFLSHLVACVWFYVAQASPYSWALASGYLGNDYSHAVTLQYLSSLYWAIVTMATIGYGDIVPKTKNELIIAMFVMVIGVSMFGYIVGNITALVDNLNASGRMQSERLTMLKEYVIARNLPKHTGKRILDHFEYFYRHRSVFDEEAILSNLPTVMRNEVVHHVLNKFISRIDFLAEFHEGLVSDMAVAMHPFFCIKEEAVYFQNEIAVHVFFLTKGCHARVKNVFNSAVGSLSLIKSYPNEAAEVTLMTLGGGEHFGEIELYHHIYGQGVRIASAVAKSYCQLTFLSRQVIERIGHTWPEILDHFRLTAISKAKKMSKRGSLDNYTATPLGKSHHSKPEKDPTPKTSRAKKHHNPLHVYATTIRRGGIYHATKDSSSSSDDDPVEVPSPADDHEWSLQLRNRRSSVSTENHSTRSRRSSKTTLGRPPMNEKKMAHDLYVLHPQDTIVVNWQVVVVAAIIYSTFMVPYEIGFDVDPVAEGLYLDYLVDAVFGVDIASTFRLAYHNAERVLVCDTKTIAKTYLKGWFVIDVISTVPIDSIGSYFLGSSNKVLKSTKLLRIFRVARLFKLARLLKIGKVFKRIRESVQLSPSMERLLKLITIMVCFGHWCACSFHWIMLFEEELGLRTWCTDYFFPQDEDPGACSFRVPVEDRYVTAMYWAFTTMTTVGYGDIKPFKFSVAELLFAVICLMVNSTVYAYIVSGFIDVIYNYDPNDREYRSRMNDMKDYVRDTAMSVRLSNNVKRHYDFLLTQTCLFPEEQIFSQLKPSLRFDVARLVAGNSIMTISIMGLMEKNYKGFVSYALFLLKPQFILRSERICRSGSPGTEMFFLIEGECEQMDHDNHNVRVLGEGAHFEAYAMLASPEEHYRSQTSVTALTPTCQVYSLSVKDFESIADLSPAISVNLSYELAKSIIQDDFITLTDEQEENVLGAIEREKSLHPEVLNPGPLSNMAKVVMAKMRIVKGSILSDSIKEAMKGVMHKTRTAIDGGSGVNTASEIEAA
ncbi:unnamed protein product [Aphanomyces euteiches]